MSRVWKIIITISIILNIVPTMMSYYFYIQNINSGISDLVGATREVMFIYMVFWSASLFGFLFGLRYAQRWKN